MVLWQAAQLFVVGMWVAVFGVALKGEPLMWQVPQSRGVPLKTALRWQALARQIAVHAVELEAGGQVIERHGDRRRLGGGSVRAVPST